jgi:hypothetical protein
MITLEKNVSIYWRFKTEKITAQRRLSRLNGTVDSWRVSHHPPYIEQYKPITQKLKSNNLTLNHIFLRIYTMYS